MDVSIILLMLLFQFKHFFVDSFASCHFLRSKTEDPFKNPSVIKHSIANGFGTMFCVALVLPSSLMLAALAGLFEMVIHYLIDGFDKKVNFEHPLYSQESMVQINGHLLMHQLSYIAILAAASCVIA